MKLLNSIIDRILLITGAVNQGVFVSHIAIVFVVAMTGCSERALQTDSEVFTLYSTNFPNQNGRYGVATFDLADESVNEMSCHEAVDLYRNDFERRKRENGWSDSIKARYWCEKGRFRK
jgi:hypothetical protein